MTAVYTGNLTSRASEGAVFPLDGIGSGDDAHDRRSFRRPGGTLAEMTWHSSRPRRSRERGALEEIDDAPRLSEAEERALDAIRRQIDIDFPPTNEEAVSRARARSRPTPSSHSRARRRAPPRPRRGAISVGMLLLLIGAAASGAGLRLAVQQVRMIEARVAVDRDAGASDQARIEVRPPVAAAPPVPLASTPSARSRRDPEGRNADYPTAPPVTVPPTVAPDVRLPARPSAVVPPPLARPAREPVPTGSVGIPPATAYFFGGRYFRHAEGAWFVADEPGGPWSSMGAEEVPAPLLALPGVYDSMAEQLKDDGTPPR
jgi:hypothetical protein